MERTKLLKVIMEYEDRIDTLEGEDAEKWLEAANSMCMIEAVHGREFPRFSWKTRKKKS